MEQRKVLNREDSLTAALGFGGALPRIISLVGAGGKTTTMYRLADELAGQGKRVLVTTSTHIRIPESGRVCPVAHVSELSPASWGDGLILTAGTPVPAKEDPTAETPVPAKEDPTAGTPVSAAEKFSMPGGLGEEAQMERLLRFVDVILIEADGAKRMPLKVPEEWEPVIVPQTGLVIACAGLGCIGRTFAESCFRFDAKGGFIGKNREDRVEPEDVALILMDSRGSRKGLAGRYYCVVLNQVDGEKERAAAEKVLWALPASISAHAVMTSYRETERGTA